MSWRRFMVNRTMGSFSHAITPLPPPPQKKKLLPVMPIVRFLKQEYCMYGRLPVCRDVIPPSLHDSCYVWNSLRYRDEFCLPETLLPFYLAVKMMSAAHRICLLQIVYSQIPNEPYIPIMLVTTPSPRANYGNVPSPCNIIVKFNLN
jgi:hypothetical protein